MKSIQVILLLACSAASASAVQAAANPLAKVFELITKLNSNIVADGEKESKAFQKFTDYCSATASEVTYEIDTSHNLANQLTSKVTQLQTDIGVGDTRIGEFTAHISKAEAELKGATAIRKTEAKEFADGEKMLMTTVDTLERALSTLEKQLAAGSSFAQIDTSTLMSIVQTLSVVDDAAALDGSSMDKLTSLLQAGEDEDEMGAPAAAAYGKQSGGIMVVLEDMRDKAEGQLADLRNNEKKAKHSYEMLRQGLQDEIKAAKKELEEEKSGKAEAAEEMASATGNLEVAKRENKASNKKRDELQSSCQTAAGNHEANVAARMEELKVIGEAERILKESTGFVQEEQPESFVQVAASTSSSSRARALQLASATIVRMVQQLAKKQHSKSLAQLASRVSAELRYGAARHGADPFRKVKDLVSSMINKLEQEASEEATEKAYCDEEMAKTKVKQVELEDAAEKLAAKIGKSVSKSSALKQEVAEIMSEVSGLTKEQATMDTIRREDHAAHMVAKADLEQGLAGVRKALTVLQDFYGDGAAAASLLQEDGDEDNMSSLMQQAIKQPSPPMKAEKNKGAGGSILGLLEVVESDMARNLATEDTEESDAQTIYDKQTQLNKITKAQKEQDAKYKTQEFKSLDKSISEMEADRATEVEELKAINEYFGKVKERCVAKPSSYEDLKARRDQEIQGLRDALASVESEAFMQVGTTRQSRARGSLRGGDALRVDADNA